MFEAFDHADGLVVIHTVDDCFFLPSILLSTSAELNHKRNSIGKEQGSMERDILRLYVRVGQCHASISLDGNGDGVPVCHACSSFYHDALQGVAEQQQQRQPVRQEGWW